MAAAIPLVTAASMALRAAGRLMVMIRMRSRCSTSTASAIEEFLQVRSVTSQ